MSGCCTSSCNEKVSTRRHRCPVNGLECSEVPEKTLLHHIKTPWTWINKTQGYYYCDDPDCDVVYFGEDDSLIRKFELRTPVGIKEDTSDSLVCYCFGITKAEAMKTPGIKEYVVQKTKEGVCTCETSNPSGRCCLKDFTRLT